MSAKISQSVCYLLPEGRNFDVPFLVPKCETYLKLTNEWVSHDPSLFNLETVSESTMLRMMLENDIRPVTEVLIYDHSETKFGMCYRTYQGPMSKIFRGAYVVNYVAGMCVVDQLVAESILSAENMVHISSLKKNVNVLTIRSVDSTTFVDKSRPIFKTQVQN